MGITYGAWVLSFSLVISVYIAYEKNLSVTGKYDRSDLMSGSGLSDEYCVGSDPHFWNWSAFRGWK